MSLKDKILEKHKWGKEQTKNLDLYSTQDLVYRINIDLENAINDSFETLIAEIEKRFERTNDVLWLREKEWEALKKEVMK